MGFFDVLKSAAGDMGDQEAHQAFDGVLQNTPLGGMSGLLGQLEQGGLGSQVEAWCQGGASNVSPDQIKTALGDEHVQAIASSLGISTDDVANHLAEHLPDMAQAHAAGQE
jgi:uncharacterized protein YidB (DUF937 family)